MKKIVLCFMLLLACAAGQAANKQMLQAMKRATQYMMEVASYNGGFVWSYLPDLSRQWGELEARRTMVWVQPPGTPAVGHLMLDAWHATHDEYYYRCAERIAAALVWGQLPCGGWNYMFDFAGETSTRQWYATVGKNAWRLEEFQHYYGNATYDDGGTMQAAKFFLRLYLEKNDPVWRTPLEKVIRFVLTSQYPVGGWPQRYPLMHDHPSGGMADYSSFITLNDDVIPEIIDFLLQCYQTLGLASLKEPIVRAMNLAILLQQGEPYPGWADQYTVDDLQPAHARSYEPRSVNTGTTAYMIHKLMEYYVLTGGDTKYLAGIPAAIRFIESQKLPETEVAKWKRRPNSPDEILVPRFVHPESGNPLYVHRKGSNVKNGHYYTDRNLEQTIVHYTSAALIDVNKLKAEYERVKAIPKEELKRNSPFFQDSLVSLPPFYYYPRRRFGQKDMTPDEIISGLTKDGYWLGPIRQISHPYKPLPEDLPASNESKFAETMVGDEYDTSPFPNTEVMGISTGVFIENMTRLIHAVAGDK
ncbi:MAG: pectate lyase [Mediterranea sp.]|jgi:PelA/Pel-15E family pectate lyase|nr:pectate lyase [Mediterranea sp.]